MTGLEKIIKSISDEAETEASKIIEDANSKASELLEKSKSDSDNNASALIKEAEDKAKVILEKAMSAAMVEKKKLILLEKQNHIKNLIDEAKNSIINLPDDQYFEVIFKMIEKSVSEGEGEIVFSERDKKRLPEDFLERLKKLSLKVSKETRNFSGGFVLVYGGIEENCSLDVLFESKYDDLCDSVNKLLFM